MPASTGPERSASDARSAIERFLQKSRQPALLEPGEELIRLGPENFSVEERNSRLTVQAWTETRNIVRRVTEVHSESAGRLELTVEKFARKEGRLYLVDLARPAGQDWERRGTRLVFQERFRQMLRRQFPDWTLAELTSATDLEHSFSDVYPRAYLYKGQCGWAAVAAPPVEGSGSGLLTAGLLWLDYLRARERRVIEGLALYLPSGQEKGTCLRVAWLDPRAAQYELFSYSEQGYAARLDTRDFGNLDTRLDVCRRPCQSGLDRLLEIPGVERLARHDGAVSYRVHGLEFALAHEGGVRFGLAEKRSASEEQYGEIEVLARELAARRDARAADRAEPLFRLGPEAWLESQARAHIQELDATLLPDPVYGQVPAFAGGARGIMDLLAADATGRLAVIELKAAADIHLPLQALDYWMRVKWHLDRGEFTPLGYFPGVALRPAAPRLLLVSPALEFHPTTEAILSYFSPQVDVERVGVGLEWRSKLAVMFRLRGAQRP